MYYLQYSCNIVKTMLLRQSYGRENTFTVLYCIYQTRNLCISEPAQLKPMLFKGQAYIFWNISSILHPMRRLWECAVMSVDGTIAPDGKKKHNEVCEIFPRTVNLFSVKCMLKNPRHQVLESGNDVWEEDNAFLRGKMWKIKDNLMGSVVIVSIFKKYFRGEKTVERSRWETSLFFLMFI